MKDLKKTLDELTKNLLDTEEYFIIAPSNCVDETGGEGTPTLTKPLDPLNYLPQDSIT